MVYELKEIVLEDENEKSWMLGGMLLTTAVLGTAVEVQFYDEAPPITLNPLFATTMVDNRAQELYFDRLYYNNPTDNSLTSRLIDDSQTKIEDAGKSLRLTLKEGLTGTMVKSLPPQMCAYH